MRPHLRLGVDAARIPTQQRGARTAVQFLIQGNLQQWLGELITIEAVDGRAPSRPSTSVSSTPSGRLRNAGRPSSAGRCEAHGLALFRCDDRRRRNEIAGRADVNGIEFLEVLDAPDQAQEDRQRTLFVHFINDPTGLGVAGERAVEGGERIRNVRVVDAQVQVIPAAAPRARCWWSRSARPVTSSTYTLRLIPTEASTLPGLDLVLRAVDFSFKVNCDTNLDPLQTRQCAVEPRTEPALDYLARDYPSFRGLMLDRLAVLLPDWHDETRPTPAWPSSS